MNEKPNDYDLNPGAIRQLLNRSLAQLDQPTLDGLRSARQQALERHMLSYARSPVRAWIDAHIAGHAPAMRFASVLLVVGLLGGIGYYWQQSQDSNEDVDIAILTDDQPINYYSD